MHSRPHRLKQKNNDFLQMGQFFCPVFWYSFPFSAYDSSIMGEFLFLYLDEKLKSGISSIYVL